MAQSSEVWSYDSYEDKSYEVTSLKYQSFDISQVIISKMWTAVLPVSCSINSTFRLINDPKKGTLLHQWFKSNLGKSYEVSSSKYWHLDISHVTTSNMWNVIHPV